MCGIAGFYSLNNSNFQKNNLIKMTETLSHRGPDDKGIFYSQKAGLGHTRLSIIDLSKAGKQPMQSKDGKVVLSYNGELYNYKSLRNELINKGVKFRSQSDTEVILESYMEWGPKIFSRFNGMFAFAILDLRLNKLFLVRDRFGIKPLYYFQNKDFILFGSEIKSILHSNIVPKDINYMSLNQYMWYGNMTGDDTIYKNISKIPPAHYMTVTNDKIELKQYWFIDKIKECSDSIAQTKINILDKLESAVKNHLISDVPVGIFLSGGVDSSAITAFAAKHYAGKINTFSVGFDFDKGVNELPKAKTVANLFNTNHHELNISSGDLPTIIEKLINCHDEPFADAANIPLYLLCNELKGSIKVILQGDGGDEIFAGYRRYSVLKYRKLWNFISKGLYPFIGLLFSNPISQQRYYRFLYANKENKPYLQKALLLTQDSPLRSPAIILDKDIQQIIGNYDPFIDYKHWHAVFKNFDYSKQMLFTDCKVQLPNTFLEKVDKSTMANSIEVRVPFLDNKLTDYALGIPTKYKVKLSQGKWILKEALKDILPKTILNGPKTGFSVPFEYWLRKPLAKYMKSVLLDNSAPLKIFDKNVLENKIEKHISGKENNGFVLWKAMNLALWYDKNIK